MKNTPCNPVPLLKILAPSGLVLLAGLLFLAQFGPDWSAQTPTDPRPWPPQMATATATPSDLSGWWEELPTAVPLQTSTIPTKE